jgi:hypothetical protein
MGVVNARLFCARYHAVFYPSIVKQVVGGMFTVVAHSLYSGCPYPINTQFGVGKITNREVTVGSPPGDRGVTVV